MGLDGSGRRLVLAAEATRRNIRVGYLSVGASPDGKRIAYIRQGESATTGRNVFDQLWTVDTTTGRKTDLGPAPSSDGAVIWMNDSSVLAESADGTALRLINVINGRRSEYLSISDPRIVRAYEDARPGAGPPTAVDPVGWNAGPRHTALALILWGVSNRFPSDAAVALVERGRVLSLAPDRNPLASLTWGPGGEFLIHTDLGNNPCCARSYVGSAATARLSRQQAFGEPWDAAAFSPRGDVIALDYAPGTTLAFVPASPPACGWIGSCLRFKPEALFKKGALQAWAPDGP